MSQFHIFITLLNSLALFYLIFLFYKKNQKISTKNLDKIAGNFPQIGLTRFNPFNDVGGNQSFILVLLDKSNSGVIITSLHNRDNTRVYAKQVKNGQGVGVTLSKEEKDAIKKTIKF